MTAVAGLAAVVGVVAACLAMNIPRASFSRRKNPRQGPPRPRATPARALSPHAREGVLEMLHSGEFLDQAPRAVWATLLDRGEYLCSPRTMYRLLAAEGESMERRAQRAHPEYHKPELLAVGPNQVWSWDITRLRGPQKWTYYYLYVVLDIFSRYVVGWMVADRENATLAKRLLAQTCAKQAIKPGQLVIHQDRGAPMTSKTVLQMYADLSVEPSYSRPHVSDDNPYSEAQFKTLKYRPDYPDRFGSVEDANGFCRPFFAWYNADHRHSGIAYMTPEAVHYGQADHLRLERQVVLDTAFAANPERFVNRPPQAPMVPREVWINPPPMNLAELEVTTPVPLEPKDGPSFTSTLPSKASSPKTEAPQCPRFASDEQGRPIPSPLDGPLSVATVPSVRPIPALRRQRSAARPAPTPVAH